MTFGNKTDKKYYDKWTKKAKWLKTLLINDIDKGGNKKKWRMLWWLKTEREQINEKPDKELSDRVIKNEFVLSLVNRFF